MGRVCVGRSLLLFGSNDQIAARMASLQSMGKQPVGGVPRLALPSQSDVTVQAQTFEGKYDDEDSFRLEAFDSSIPPQGGWRPLTALENISGS